MSYTRLDTWPDSPERHDYLIRCEGLEIGRMYLSQRPEGAQYTWFVYLNGHVSKVPGVPIAGRAAALDEASSAFQRSYEAMREKAGLPKLQR